MPKKHKILRWHVYSLHSQTVFYRKLLFIVAIIAVCVGSICAFLLNSNEFYSTSDIDSFIDTQYEDETKIQVLYPLQTSPPFIIALDPGHGGIDDGAAYYIKEVDLCEKTVDALYQWLEVDPNYLPVKTRKANEKSSSDERAQVAIDNKASLLLSVHGNCDPGSNKSHGFECYPTPPGRTYSEESMRFAQYIVQGMKKAGHRMRGKTGIHFIYYNGKKKIILEGTETEARNQKSFGVLEKPLCPAVLVEQCFISNYNDVQNWGTSTGCKHAARIYYEAICMYFDTKPLPLQQS